MACMTHTCKGCGWDQFNNKGGPDEWPCPKCGGEEFSKHFDEQYDRDERDYEEDDDE